jgi:acetyl/propionyl-CoA carboxylase alpha subunit
VAESGLTASVLVDNRGEITRRVLATAHRLGIRTVAVCAEDPSWFLPSPGTTTEWAEPAGPGIRVEPGMRPVTR